MENRYPTQRTPRLITLAPKTKFNITRGPGTLTGRFFLAGETQEATDYENVVVEDISQPAITLDLRSFKKVPRRWSPLIAFLSFTLLIIIVLINWNELLWLSKQPLSWGMVYEAIQTNLPIKPHTKNKTTTIQSEAKEKREITETTIEQPVLLPVNPIQPFPHDTAPTSMAAKPKISDVVPDQSYPNDQPNRLNTEHEVENHRIKKGNKPLRGYSWSPSSNALLPIQKIEKTEQTDN